MMKYTKQGIRDLDALPSKPTGRKLDEPPNDAFCNHSSKKDYHGDMLCSDCGQMWDFDGNPY
jgi:hypothetical protein